MAPLLLPAALLAGLLALAPAPAPAAPAGVEEDLAAARALAGKEKWTEAAAALRAILDGGEGDPEVRARLPEIEEDLLNWTFRAQAGKPSGKDLFGDEATSFDLARGRVVLEFPDGPSGRLWEPGETVDFLRVRFKGEVNLEFDATDGPVTVIFSWDPEAGTGYLATPGVRWTDLNYIKTLDARILRLDPGERKAELVRKDPPDRQKGKVTFLARKTYSGMSIQRKGGPKTSASDGRYKEGYVGLKAPGAEKLEVSGFVEDLELRSRVAAWTAERLRLWTKNSWNRREALPAWALRPAPAAAAAAPHPLPADAGPPPEPLVRALDCWRRGERLSFLRASAEVKSPSLGTRLYLDGLACIATGRIAEAEKSFTLLAELDAAFAPARLYRGVARLRRRDVEGARADLRSAREGAAAFPELWTGLATLSVLGGNLAEARDLLMEGRRAGAGGEAFGEFEAWVLRSHRGPNWARSFESTGKCGTVRTDHSQKLCHEVSTALDMAVGACASVLPGAPRPAAPVRVHLFASREGYLAYAGDLGRDLDSAAGAYVPGVRELVLFVPEVGRELLWDTVRHEAFHAFLHDLVEDPPIWFDEGWAECMEGGRTELGSFKLSMKGEDFALLRPGVDVEAFMNMGREEFMKGAERNYPLARALVTFLHSSEKPRYRERLSGYLEALRAGASGREAFEKEFRPVIAELTAAFGEWVKRSGSR